MQKYDPKKIEGKQIYDFKSIETKWQKVWLENGYGLAKDFEDKPKHYHLVEFPYPSGAGLHVGHCMGYGASDAYCRMKRMQGYNVMYPIGWDAFGLPTENYAIKTGTHPSKVTAKSIAIFKQQIKSLGYAFDWDREINTTDPDYYGWTQWIFLQFYKHAIADGKLIKVADDDTVIPRLAYQKEMPINWCPSCKIGLANEEVISGACERCGTQTEKRMQKQWLLRITAYADRLIKDLDTVDYLDKIKTQQVNWIGRSIGARVKFEIRNSKFETNLKSKIELDVFTTRPDTLFGATFMVVAPEHPLIEKVRKSITNYEEVLHYINEAKKKSDLERTELNKDKTGVEIKGIKAINPANNKEIPIFVADYVLISYGTGAVMAVPAHDERDWEFAKKYNLSIKQVIADRPGAKAGILKQPFTEDGYLIDSAEFSSLESANARDQITEKLVKLRLGNFAKNYKLRDWIFSRQHYWGEPIPIIHCQKCGIVSMDEKELPLALPEVENYQPTDTGESPLAKITDWVNTTCPKCGGMAKRETDTMPNWAGSSWYFLAYAARQLDSKTARQQEKNNNQKTDLLKFKNIFLENKAELNYWLPVDIYNGGMEHTTLHLLYSRFWHKFLFDLGVVSDAEPYAKRIAHGIILGPDGQKMSKSKGNVINPDDIVAKFGADTLRAYIMFIGPYDQESAWSMAGVQGVFRFLNRVWNNQDKVKAQSTDSDELLVKLNQTIQGVSDDIENFRMNTVISKLMEMNNAIEKTGSISLSSYQKYLKLLFPVVPHIAEELWSRLEQANNNGLIEDSKWPDVDSKYLVSEKIEIVIQVNGKIRDKIEVASDISDEEMEKLALTADKVKTIIGSKEVAKTIIVPKKLVSIVTK